MKKYTGIIIIIFIITSNALFAIKERFKTLESLNFRNVHIKSLRKDISKSISITKGKRNPKLLPELKFYKYKIKKDDTFWKILTKTSLNIDTLITVNSLSSPMDISSGKTIFIPNMRGIIHKVKKRESIADISRKYEIDPSYICKINKITDKKKTHVFIPCARVSKIERSLFLGVGFANPLKSGRRTSNFGRRIDPFNKKLQFHKGIDIACPVGSRIYAAREGKVFFAGYKGGYGKLVIIKHKHGYYSYYGHLSRFKKKKGSHVKRGELIALSGNSGRSTGPHLHFEIRKKNKPINPGILLR